MNHRNTRMGGTRTAGGIAALAALAGLLAMGTPAWGAEGSGALAGAGDDYVVALVDGRPVTLAELQDKQIHDLRRQLHDAVQQKLTRATLERLAGRHAGYGSEDPGEISAAEIRAFYKTHNLAERGSLEKLTPAIRGYLRGQRTETRQAALLQRAERAGLLRRRIVPPGDFVVRVPLGPAAIRGRADAAVMVVEFSDFQCPYCARMQPVVRAAIKDYGKRVGFAYRHFPLDFHTEADEAALAVECAREQGRFAAYHGKLYANPKRQHVADLKRYAGQVGVGDLSAFNACLDGRRYQERVDADIALGKAVGVTGTPSFVIGRYDAASGEVQGDLVSGAVPSERFRAHIEKFLAPPKP